MLRQGLVAVVAGALLVACGSRGPEALDLRAVVPMQQAVWTNGNFESGSIGATPPGWTVTNYSNAGVSGTASAPPASLSALNLGSGGVLETFIVGGANNTQIDPDLGSGQAFRFPLFGVQAARVNFKDSNTANGNNKNANLMQQSQVLTSADVDPSDGLVHVRFALAPVLENPSHGFTQQPYYYVELLDVTQNTTLFSAFNVAGGGGNDVPWHTTTSLKTGNTVQWLNWRLVDISSASSNVAVGDQVRLNVVGSGCSLGGHFGRIYVDGLGTTVPGVYTEATAPSSVSPSSTLTYTINYANGGTANAAGTNVTAVLPHGTTFASTSLGSACTAPSASNSNTLTCLLGTLSPGTTGSFTMTVNVPSTASGTLVLGNYGITSSTTPTLIGPEVDTTVITGTNADISISVTSPVTSVTPGQVFLQGTPLYKIYITNNSPTTATTSSNEPTITSTWPSYVDNANWKCSVVVGGSGSGCSTTKTKRGNLSVKATKLAANGGQILITAWGTIDSAATGVLTDTATVTAAPGIADPNMSNNTASLSLFVGNPNRLTVVKGGTGAGTVSSSPSGLACGSSCNANFIGGTAVTLYESPSAGSTFTGWSGGVCSGTANSCTVNLAGNTNVTANFSTLTAGPAANMYAYQGNMQTAPLRSTYGTPVAVIVTDANGIPVNGQNVSFAISPSDSNVASLSANANTTNSTGITSVVVNGNTTVGPFNVTASATGLSPVVFQLTNVGNANSLLYLSGGTSVDPQLTPLSTAFGAQLLVEVIDAAGSPVQNTNVTFVVIPSGGASATLSASKVKSDASGLAGVYATANGTAGSYTAQASAANSNIVFQLQNISSSPNQVFVVSGSGQTTAPGSLFGSQLIAVVADSLGNPVSNQNLTFTPPSSGAGASLVYNPNRRSDINGQVYATATANNNAGPYNVVVTIDGLSGPSASFALVNDGGYTLTLVGGSPQSATVNTAYATVLAVNLTDPNDNNVQGANITFQAPTSGATGTMVGGTSCGTGCRVAVTDLNGNANVTITANTASGVFTVVASNPNVADSVEFALTNNGGAASTIAATGGTPQSAVVGSGYTVPLMATVSDAYGNAVENANVVFNAGSGSISLSGATVVTNVAGQASVSATAGNMAGTYTVVATTTGAAGSANFVLTNTCAVDSNCTAGNWCNAGSCAPTLANGIAMPTVSGHTPTLDGTCSAPAAGAVCTSGVCDTSDNKCGYSGGDGSCNAGNAGSVCRSGTCSTTNVCLNNGTCLADGDCTGGKWCSISTRTCMTPLANGTPMPTDSNHTVPVLDGNCTQAAATLVCTGQVCDTSDKACGYANGDGVCDNSNATVVCRAQVCGSDNVCGYANGDNGCTAGNAATVCRSGTCDTTTNACAGPASCSQDSDCPGQWCSVALSLCQPLVANGGQLPTDASHTSPVLNGNCIGGVGALVCASGVCDANDNRCGYNNTDGTCDNSNATTVCRSGVCGNDHACGYGSGDGPCSGSSATALCRSATCSAHASVCVPTGGCASDLDCTNQWCDISAFACTNLLPNGTAMPVDPPHTSPTLDGNCTVAAGGVVCQSGVCDPNDKACGYANGDGVCDNSNATTVCRSQVCGSGGTVCGLSNGDAGCTVGTGSTLCQSGSCSNDGRCMAAGSCHVDVDCGNANWCDIHAGTCHTPLANGTGMPSDPNHTSPVLDGNCSGVGAALVCQSGVCDTTDKACGYLNGDGTCNNANATTVCRSTVCGSNNVCGYAVGDAGCTAGTATAVCQSGTCSHTNHCMPPSGCLADNDCSAGQWCSISTTACSATLANGHALPTDAAHSSPTLNGNCLQGVGALVCSSGVCDPNDNACGYLNGDGVCDNSNATTVCRAQVCGSDHQCGYANGDGVCDNSNATTVCRAQACGSDHACGLANGDGSCPPSSSTAQCRSGYCSAAGTCAPVGVCVVDGDCTAPQWCNIASGSCTPAVANGQPMPVDASHTSPVLDGNCNTAAAALVCASHACDGNDKRCGYASGDGNCLAGDPNGFCRAQTCGSDGHCGFGNGDGPCNNSNAVTVCRSGTCSVDATCMPNGGCDADGDCAGGFCNRHSVACQPLVPNGGAMPVDPNHLSPVLDGNCHSNAATLVCASTVCDATDNRCGYANGDGVCTANNAGSVCRSGVCSTSDQACGYGNGEGPCSQGNATVVCRGGACSAHANLCEPLGGCAVDADCGAQQFCDTSTYGCSSKLGNGTAIPTLTGHTPALTGTCSASVAAAVCASGVCDHDNACGYADNDGPCSSATASLCRSAVCSADGNCLVPGQCAVDADCVTGVQFCNTQTLHCAAKLVDGAPLTVVTGHSPDLNGTCSTAVAAVMCLAGVCDSDNKCGYQDQSGPCTAANAGSVCRSSTCSPHGNVCIPSGGCGLDSDCLPGFFCNTAALACVSVLDNGTALPVLAGHSPVLDGNCTAGVGSSVCASGVCDPNDNRCGLLDGDGPCTLGAGAAVCRSADCSVAGLCNPPSGCTIDGDCTAQQYCDNSSGTCAPKGGNGSALPVVLNHAPSLDGTCSTTAAAIACISGVCSADNRCGYGLGDGPCSGQGTLVCRSGQCASQGVAANTCVTCTTDSQCTGVLGVCSASNTCVACLPGDANACVGSTPLCNATTSTCAPCNGDYAGGATNPCPNSSAPLCHLSGAQQGTCGMCTSDTDCSGHTGPHCDTASGACTSGCSLSSDCNTGTYCNVARVCVPQVSNGQALPNEAGGQCTAANGNNFCASGACGSDGLCGYTNSEGPCLQDGQCRSGACDTHDSLCGYAAGDGRCTTDGQCRVGSCDASQVCTLPCANDDACTASQYCTSGACTADLADGVACDRAAQCQSNQCSNGACGQPRWIPAGHGLFAGCANTSPNAAGLLVLMCIILRHMRRRRV